MATKLTTIKISKDRHGGTLRGGINGRSFAYVTGQKVSVEPEVVEHLRNSGVSFEEVSEGVGSKEGSAVPAPDTKPSMLPRSSDESGGDQPGDVTGTSNPSVPKATDSKQEKGDNSLAEAARVSDIRVAAERRVGEDASIAERAGEGEQGTAKAEPAAAAPASKKRK